MRAALTVPALLVLAAPASAAAPQDGKYTGSTSQKLSIKVTVATGAIVKMRFFVKNNCGATKKPITVASTENPIPVTDSGRFSVSYGDGAFRTSGTFASDGTVRGKLRERIPNEIVGSGKCDTGKVTFSASR